LSATVGAASMQYTALLGGREESRSCKEMEREGSRLGGGSSSEGDRRVMSLRELWSPETVAPKIRNDLSRLAGKQSVPTKPHPRDHHVTNVAAY
jgi:hypothetical protein